MKVYTVTAECHGFGLVTTVHATSAAAEQHAADEYQLVRVNGEYPDPGEEGYPEGLEDLVFDEHEVPCVEATLASGLATMLRELEWSATVDDSRGGYNDGCPVCEATKPGSGDREYEGHPPTCRLVALLKRAEEAGV